MVFGLGALTGAQAQPVARGDALTLGTAPCLRDADPACLHRLSLPGGAGALAYYTSASPGATAAPPTEALVVIHGYSRNVRASFRAGLEATERAQRAGRTLVVAPAFQVVPAQAPRCQSRAPPTWPRAMPYGPAAAGRKALCRAAVARSSARSRHSTP